MSGVPYRVWLLVVYLLLLAVSLITTEILPLDTLMLHLPTVLFLAWLVWTGRGHPLSNHAYTRLFLFGLLHLVGSHYLYSFVPYDSWAQSLTGTSFAERFGWERNHFDRLVHFSYGLLLVRPCCELFEQRWGLRGLRAIAVAILFLSFGSMFYELVEWGIAATMSPETAENYNGQQGDVFDAQKDMALAFVGNLIGAGVLVVTGWRVPGTKGV